MELLLLEVVLVSGAGTGDGGGEVVVVAEVGQRLTLIFAVMTTRFDPLRT